MLIFQASVSVCLFFNMCIPDYSILVVFQFHSRLTRVLFIIYPSLAQLIFFLNLEGGEEDPAIFFRQDALRPSLHSASLVLLSLALCTHSCIYRMRAWSDSEEEEPATSGGGWGVTLGAFHSVPDVRPAALVCVAVLRSSPYVDWGDMMS